MSLGYNIVVHRKGLITMEKTSYHHRALRETLIETGIQMIIEEGVDQFSLRKLAARCHVSHTAPYKHFKNKEALLEEMIDYVMQDFSNEILRVAQASPKELCALEIGKRYVTYMLEHRDYFQLLFLGNKKSIVTIEDSKFVYEKGHPFGTFAEVATEILRDVIKDEQKRNHIILHCWSTVHGLTHLMITGVIEYNGDISKLAESMLDIDCL